MRSPRFGRVGHEILGIRSGRHTGVAVVVRGAPRDATGRLRPGLAVEWSLITQLPLGGKAGFGGHRLGGDGALGPGSPGNPVPRSGHAPLSPFLHFTWSGADRPARWAAIAAA